MDSRIGWLWQAPVEDGRVLIFLPRSVRRRRFWCAFQRREVEVEFEENGPPGLRQAVAVRSCSAFDPPTAVACGRRCLDVGFRQRWQPALPVDTAAGR